MEFKTIIEPFRIRQVQPIRSTTRDYRAAAFEKCWKQCFSFKSRRCLNRFVDRLWHGCNVQRTMGGHDAKR